MTTAQHLEDLTDDAAFERLATALLGHEHLDGRHLHHTGINAKHQAVKAPLDGFGQVPHSDPPRFIFAQHTVTALSGLERKWLNDPALTTTSPARKRKAEPGPGDLIKAAAEADKLRPKFPGATFTVILTSNRRVPQDLLTEVYARAHALGVACEVWDQTRLAGFLDERPYGQWLRHQYLGIDAELLSMDLLLQIASENCTRYESFVRVGDGRAWVTRRIDAEVTASLEQRALAAVLLVGDSGFGKSALAAKVLRAHIERGHPGLWLNASVLGHCLSFDEAIARVLHDHRPTLQRDAALVLRQLLDPAMRLLVIVDDVNRAADPPGALRKLLTWVVPARTADRRETATSGAHLVLCPVWSQHRDAGGAANANGAWLRTFTVGPFSVDESRAAMHCDHAEIGTVADDLAGQVGHDPLLVTFLREALESTMTSPVHTLANQVLELFINSALTEAAQRPGVRALQSDYRRALDLVCLAMLRNRDLHPLWPTVRRWLTPTPDALEALRELAQHGRLCREEAVGGEHRLSFRHDRVREALIVQVIVQLLTEDWRDELLIDPAYAEFVGRALAIRPQPPEVVGYFADHHPLVLAEALRHLGPAPESVGLLIANELRRHLVATYTRREDYDYDFVAMAIFHVLSRTDSPLVLSVTQGLPSHRTLLLARLRNGCARSGAERLARRDDLASIELTDPAHEEALSACLVRNRTRFLDDLRELIVRPGLSVGFRLGALSLAGFVGEAELMPALLAFWRMSDRVDEHLPLMIWAACRCVENDLPESLDPIFDSWSAQHHREVADHKATGTRPPGFDLSEMLRIAFRDRLSEPVVGYLVTRAARDDELEVLIAEILSETNLPGAIEFTVRRAASIRERSPVEPTVGSLRASIVMTQWYPNSALGRQLSPESRKRLLSLWQSAEESPVLREVAFDLWAYGVVAEDLDHLRSVSLESSLHPAATRARARLGDHTCVPDLVRLLDTDVRVLGDARFVWCDGIRQAVEQRLAKVAMRMRSDTDERSNDQYYLSRFLLAIPEREAEDLLFVHWKKLRSSSVFIEAAILLGSRQARDAGLAALQESPARQRIVQRIVSTGDLMEVGMKPRVLACLDDLIPYLSELEDLHVSGLLDLCQRAGRTAWIRQNLRPYVNDGDRRRFVPDDDDLARELDKIAVESPTVRHYYAARWCEDFTRRSEPPERAFQVLERWWQAKPDFVRFMLLVDCLHAAGSRANLRLFEIPPTDGDPREIARLKAGMTFAVRRRTLT